MNRNQLETKISFEINLLGILSDIQDWFGETHSHPFWELIYVHSGEIMLVIDNLHSITLSQNDVFLIKPNQVHHITNNGDCPATIMYIGCDCFFIIDDNSITRANILAYPALDTLCDKIKSKIDTGMSSKEQLRQFQFEILPVIYDLFLYLSSNSNTLPSTNDKILSNVKMFIKANIDSNITVHDIAKSLYISPHYLGHLFKKQTGFTIKEYILSIRMSKAFDLIKHTDMSINDIATKVGYDTPQYFSTCFSNYYGTSPSSLRKNSN